MSSLLGKPAPSFTLYNTQKEAVSLSDFQGKKVVLLFFPLAFTAVCTAELCSARDNMHQYEKLNAQILAISVDTVFTLAKFKEEQQLNFPLLSDFNKTTAAAYNALYPEFVLGMKGVAKRSAFVIDENGVVIHEEILENAGEMPSFEAIAKALAN
ncbi:MAG: peroxiredoxin [Chitinophagales bacterium]|nr:peroxiredoxin [Bacteroidota bacterium]MCB9042290.1 peroxiredoxin [Chitinophagales bacterium]